ncbi:blast:FAD-dependent oxidoreductase domain-containing protein 1 [Drosophila guanche]|uniref:FAD-dependent oxidoreductase domain-containing protein 1 n=1 Tax=Drosophila guanche TaxID=7266 RepID=A0A3B0IZJ2_DROGU|nr:blast:FAD-dependent oxidoreductase domain-containing protein 1 [Drosophila guanche]
MLPIGRVLRSGALQQLQLRCQSSKALGDALPNSCDVLIVGGGGMGASSAFWLTSKTRQQGKKLNVLVVERDHAYTKASTVLSVGGVRQQFSLAENIQMGLYGHDFIVNSQMHLGDVDLCFQPHGYLVMATSKGAEILTQNSKLQNELGARNKLLGPEALRKQFPWLSTDQIELGCYGIEKEGWFDPWALLMGFKKQARSFGAQFANGEVIGFEWDGAGALSGAVVDAGDGIQRTVKFDTCVLAAGAHSGQLASLANIGSSHAKEALLRVPLPVEPRKRYVYASTVLSVGGVRQQFSLAENIQMGLYGHDFIVNSQMHLGDVDLCFQPHGYLVMATSKGAEILTQNSKLQNELGARNKLLGPEALRKQFPWLSTDQIELGCYGIEKEGWFDPWALLMGFKKQARSFGAQFANGEVIGFEWDGAGALSGAVVDAGDGIQRTVKFDTCVLAAGAHSGQLASLANIGSSHAKEALLRVPLPVEPRKRYVYVFSTQGENCPGLATPLTIDPDGTYFRRDGLGGNFLCGRSPCDEEEPNCETLDVDHGYFDTDIWPTLANRVPCFEAVKVQSSWAGYYEHNTFDANGIIGRHPHYSNLLIAAGFSGHGIQQTPAVGRAISEQILEGRFSTLDLSRLSFDRIVKQQPMFEVNIV